MNTDDFALLTAYTGSGESAPFSQLVRRHAGLVYGAARRQTNDHHLAEEITQAVFVILARKASSIRSSEHLVGFLVKTTRFAALDAMKQHRRHEAHLSRTPQSLELFAVEGTEKERLREVEPLLDEALATLSTGDQAAVATRYLERRSLREVAELLSCTEEAAKKKVARALEKLRVFFVRRGVTLSVGALANALAIQAEGAVPAGLAAAATSAAMSTGVSSAALPLVQSTMKAISMAKAQAVGMTVAASALVIATTTVIIHGYPATPSSVLPKPAINAIAARPVTIPSSFEKRTQPTASPLTPPVPVYPRPLIAAATLPIDLNAQTVATAEKLDDRAAATQEKLNSIIIPQLELKERTLLQSLSYLEEKIRELDPDGVGVHFIGGPTSDTEKSARITISLANIPAFQALRYVTELSSMKFRVTELGVEVLPLSAK